MLRKAFDFMDTKILRFHEVKVEHKREGLPRGCLLDLSDDMATKVDVQFYADAKDAMLKALVE